MAAQSVSLGWRADPAAVRVFIKRGAWRRGLTVTMSISLRFFLCLLGLMALGPLRAQESVHTLSAEQWERPREAALLTQYPSLQAVLKDFNSAPTALLQIRYPGGEQGEFWAQELSDWLVTLGVPSARIDSVSGSANPGIIELTVMILEE